MPPSAKKRPATEGGGRSNSKRKYQAGTAAIPRHGELSIGMTGVLVSCDTHVEKSAIRESFKLFEALAEAEGAPAAAGTSSAAEPTRSVTAGSALERELAELRQQTTQSGGAASGEQKKKPFSVAQTGCAGNVMIRFEDKAIDPLALVTRAMDAALASGKGECPHVVRMLPVAATCAAKPSAIAAAVSPLIEAALKGFEGTYAVQWRRRCNSTVDKGAAIDAVASAVAEAAPKARVDLKGAEVAILCDVIKTTCCVSVLPRWQEFRQYNYRALTEAAAGEEVDGVKQAEKPREGRMAGGGDQGSAAAPAAPPAAPAAAGAGCE